jgi:lysozyme family protein
VGAKSDGEIGPKTLAAVDKYVDEMGASVLIEEYNDARLSFLKSLSTWGTFGRGWGRRVEETREFSLSLKD